MVAIFFSDDFATIFSGIKDPLLRTKIRKQIKKLRQNPKAGKPMRYDRKGTRELYIKPLRLSYIYIASRNRIVLYDLYHKKKQ